MVHFLPWRNKDPRTHVLIVNASNVESGLSMELTLNLAWFLLAALMFGAWLQFAPCNGLKQRMPDRRVQFIALALVLLILFPVISVTDDLIAAQNPAETDSCMRRDHAVANPHSIFHAVAALPQSAFAELSFGFLRFVAPGNLPVLVVEHPGLAGIQNRPPPVA